MHWTEQTTDGLVLAVIIVVGLLIVRVLRAANPSLRRVPADPEEAVEYRQIVKHFWRSPEGGRWRWMTTKSHDRRPGNCGGSGQTAAIAEGTTRAELKRLHKRRFD